MKIETIAVHGGAELDPVTGAISPPNRESSAALHQA